MIDAINTLLNSGDAANIELGIMQAEAQGFDFAQFPLLAGARSLAAQIGGDWRQYSTHNLDLTSKGIIGALDFRAYGTSLKKLHCSRNQITAINLLGCAELRVLNCSENEIDWLNTDGCYMLEKIIFFDNRRPIKIYLPKQYTNKCYVFGCDDCKTTLI